MQILIEFPSVLALSQFRCEKYDKFESLLSRKLESSSFENMRSLIFVFRILQVLALDNVSSWCECEDLVEDDGFEPRSMLTIPIYNSQRYVMSKSHYCGDGDF